MRRDTVLAILQNHRTDLESLGVTTLSLFGSTARDEAHDDSDVDLLVTFQRVPTFLTYMEAKAALEGWLGTKVDLVTQDGLLARVRPKVMGEAIHVP